METLDYLLEALEHLQRKGNGDMVITVSRLIKLIKDAEYREALDSSGPDIGDLPY